MAAADDAARRAEADERARQNRINSGMKLIDLLFKGGRQEMTPLEYASLFPSEELAKSVGAELYGWSGEANNPFGGGLDILEGSELFPSIKGPDKSEWTLQVPGGVGQTTAPNASVPDLGQLIALLANNSGLVTERKRPLPAPAGSNQGGRRLGFGNTNSPMWNWIAQNAITSPDQPQVTSGYIINNGGAAKEYLAGLGADYDALGGVPQLEKYLQQYADWQAKQPKDLQTAVQLPQGFDDAFFTGIRNDAMGVFEEDIARQKEKEREQIAFALARAGLTDSSVAASKYAELSTEEARARAKGMDTARDFERKARGDVASEINTAKQLLQSTADPSQAISAARSAAELLRTPAPYSLSAPLFENVSGTIGYAQNRNPVGSQYIYGGSPARPNSRGSSRVIGG